MDNSTNLSLFQGLSTYIDKKEILSAIVNQLEKDTGLDYTQVEIDAENPHFFELRSCFEKFKTNQCTTIL